MEREAQRLRSTKGTSEPAEALEKMLPKASGGVDPHMTTPPPPPPPGEAAQAVAGAALSVVFVMLVLGKQLPPFYERGAPGWDATSPKGTDDLSASSS